MKKFALIIALVVSLGLVGSLFASPASAFFFGGGFGAKGCGTGYGYCAPAYCAPVYCAPYCCPAYPCKPMKMKGMKAKKAKPVKPEPVKPK